MMYDSTRIKKISKGHQTGQLGFVRWMHYTYQEMDPLEAEAVHVMNYLAHGLENKKWKRSTALAYKSAVLHLFSVEHRDAISANHDFQQFVSVMGTSGFKRLRNYEIDMSPLLNYLKDLGDNHNMSMEHLTAKTCFLLSVCGLLRADDLECTDVSQSKISGGNLTLTVLFPKELRGGESIIKPVVVSSHPVEALCPVKAYAEYRRRTEADDDRARKAHPKIKTERYTPLIRYLKDFSKSLGHERITHYIQDIMRFIPRDEGQPKYKARAVGATMALKQGIPVDDVTTHGNWSSPVIVEQFYRLSRTLKNNFTTTILS